MCVCVCVCVCVSVCVCVCVCVCVIECVCACVRACVRVHVHKRMHVDVRCVRVLLRMRCTRSSVFQAWEEGFYLPPSWLGPGPAPLSGP